MIREERDPTFWAWVLSSPEVQQGSGSGPERAAAIVGPAFLPLASEHGGYIFARLDGLGRVWELHSLYRPEGWGREALLAGRDALEVLFGIGAQILTTSEAAGNWRSRPPKTFRFQPAGPMAESRDGELRTWFLTHDAWTNAPARRAI